MSSAAVLVEKATSDLLTEIDWTMNIDICDSINNDHWNEEILAKCLELNDKLQTLLIKHDTLASGFPLQIEVLSHNARPNKITLTASNQAEQEEEDDDDNEEENAIPQLVHRRSKPRSLSTETTTSIGTEDHNSSLNKSSITPTFSSGSTHSILRL